jgi:hypothetical protein
MWASAPTPALMLTIVMVLAVRLLLLLLLLFELQRKRRPRLRCDPRRAPKQCRFSRRQRTGLHMRLWRCARVGPPLDLRLNQCLRP